MNNPLLSIACTTYNHEKYIAQAIEGFLLQKTSFPIEIIIHDDASTDGTTKIVKKYVKKSPNIIIPIFQNENQYSQGIKPSTNYVFPKCRGKYIALCEGDDYWTDPYKLQKQVDFLEANPDYVMCYHNAKIIDENGKLINPSKLRDNLKRNFAQEELIKGEMVLPLSLCFRNVLNEFPEEFFKVKNGDKFLTSLLGNYGKGKYMEEISDAIYRKHSTSVWSSLDEIKQIYYNGDTRAWLYRYYKRIGEKGYANYFKNEVVSHFNQVIKYIIAHKDKNHNENINNIIFNYSDVISNEILKHYKNILLKEGFEIIVSASKNDKPEKCEKNAYSILNPSSNILKIGNVTDELQVNWIVTRKCNYQCSYCTVKDNKNGFFVSNDNLFQAVEKISKVNKKKFHFVLSGGEPTIHPDYKELLKKIFIMLGSRARITTITNLSRSINFYSALLLELDEYKDQIRFITSYHFDYADKNQFVENIKILHSNNIRIQVSIMAHPEHIEEVKELHDRLIHYKNGRTVINIMMIRENYGSYPDKRYNQADINWLSSINQSEDNPQIPIEYINQDSSKLITSNTTSNELIAKNLNDFKGYLCNAGLDFISINANGDIDPAVCFRGRVYNKPNIYHDNIPLNLFKEPIRCPFEKCGCVADLSILKVRRDYHLYRKSQKMPVKTTQIDNVLDMSLTNVGWNCKKELYVKYIEAIDFQIKSNSPTISIVVISWRLHPDNLKSFQILEKQIDQNFELIFVNNGGKDGEFDVLKPFINTYVKLNTNTGAYLARNVGALFAKAPILFFLEDDGLPAPNIIKAHLQVFKKYDVIACRGVYTPKTYNPLNKIAGHYYLGEKEFPIYADLEGNTSYRSDIFYRVGGWDDNIKFGGGGVELSIRLSKIETDLRKQIYSPVPIIYHDYAIDEEHLKTKRKKQEKSKIYLRKKHPEWDHYISNYENYKNVNPLLKNTSSVNVNKPLITICIPTFNRASYLKEAIQSALKQTYKHFKILIIDDGSQDNTVEVVKSFDDDRIKYIKNGENKGRPITRNRAIRETHTEYILWLDDDDLLKNNIIETYMKLLKDDPSIDIIYCNLQLFDNDTGKNLSIIEAKDWSYSSVGLLESLINGVGITNPGSLIRKSLYEKVGFYNESFIRAQDYEFWSRAARYAKFMKVNKVLCKYRKHSGNISLGQNVDYSYDSLLIRNIISENPLSVIFTKLDWSRPKKAKDYALYNIAKNLMRIKDYYNAEKFLFSIIKDNIYHDAFKDFILCNLLMGKIINCNELMEDFKSSLYIDDKLFIQLKEKIKNYRNTIKNIEIYLNNKQFKNAKKLSENIVSTFGVSYDVEFMLAKHLENTNSINQALEHYKLALALRPNDDLLEKIINLSGSESETENIRQIYERILCEVPLFSETNNQEQNDLVSIIIPTYNRPDMLSDALMSIFNQTYQNFEIIVVNDAGDDVENIVTSLNQKGNITYIKHSKNRGVAAARNAGIKVARGKYIAYLDDDDIFYPDHIETLVNFLEGSEYKVAYADANRALQAPKGNIYQIVRRDLLYSIEFSRDLLLVQNISPVQCFMHERSCVHQVGFFDETLTTHEDWDMWIRLSRKFDFKHIKRVTSEFRSRQDGSNMTSSRLPDFLTTMQVIFERYKKLTNGNPQLIEIQQKRLRSLENEICLSKDNISCSIIIITYNSLEDIQKCVDSISRNTSFPYEIIVIDNASSDGTQEYLKTLKNAKIILNSTNNGFSKGCNQGIQIAKGDYVVLLNPDTMVTQDWDAHLISHFKEGVGAVGPVSNYVAGLQKVELYFKENLSGQIDINVLEKELYQQNKGKCTETKLLIGFCMMLKREVIEKVGMVDEDLFLGNDDLDLSLRLRNNGYRLLVAADTFIYHKGQASFKSEPSEKTKALVQESTDVLYKKLQKQYGPDQVPSSQELWGIDWFKPSKDISEENGLTSIVILAHNQLEYTKKCIESILRYTRDPFELIVVDNGSTDGTVQYLENLKCRYGANCTDQKIEASKPKGRKKKKGKKIVALNKACAGFKVIRNEENLGFAAGNNQGMAISKGDFILLMNNDLVVTQGWLNRMISCAERSPKIGIVGPMSNYVSGPQLVKEVSYDTTSLARLNKYARKFAENNADQAKLFLRVVGFCMLIKRAVIDKIGGLDDRYGLGNFEDDDFSLRAALAGFESWIAEDCFVHHFGSRTFIGAKIDYNESLHKNWEIFKKKWGLPQDLNYGSSYTFSHIQNDGFDPAKHYCPLSRNDILPEKPDIISGSPGEIYGAIQPILAKGQHEKAIIALEKLLESYPDFALAHNDLGVLYFNKREKEKALNHYEKAAQLEPNNITFQKNLSDFYFVELGRLEEALQGYVHVLSINPKDVETLLIVGHICVALHKFDDAQVFYSRVLEIEPENVDARQNLDKLVSGQLPVVSGQPEQDSVALKPASFLTNQENDKKNENMESQQEASSKSIRASIIIPALNQQKLIKKCVKSIQEYTSEPYEIIFVNKGAKSSTLKWLRSVVKENENYHLVELEKDADFAITYNKGIEASSGEYIVLLHGDVVVTEGWLSGLLECINSAPDAGIVGPMTNNASGVQKVSDSGDISIDHLEEFAKSFRERNRYCRVPSTKLSEFCLLFRRELVGKIGPFDESLGQSNLEVDDICLRAALEGYRNNIVGDVFVYKYNGPELIGNKKSFTEKWNGIDAQNPLGKKLITLNAIEKAAELDEKGQIDDAVKILVQGTAHAPDDKRLYYTFAELLINNKHFKDALDALNEIPPDNQDVKKLELTGYCMEGMEQYKEAEEYADHALSLDAASALALNLKGILAYRQGDNRTAEGFFNRAIESAPYFGEPYTNLGALKWAMEEHEEGLDLYERGFILSPTIIDIATIYHSAVTELGEFERAEPVFRDASALHPYNRRLKYLLIDIYIQQDKHDLAMEEIEGAMIAFGIDDGILSAALKVRETLGSKEIKKVSKNKNTISLCMIVKNEEQHLAKCLRSVKPVVDEMIVVDTGSTDRTRYIARVFGARVYDFEWKDDFSEARNFSISKAHGKWIFVMDADEVISPLDYGALIKLVKKSTSRSVAYSFVTRNYSTRANTIGWTVNDGKYGAEEAGSGWMPSTKVRLFHNVSHIRFEYPVHEKVEPALKRSGIEMKKCNVPVHHYGQLNKEKSDINTKGEAYYHMGRKKLNEMGDDLVAIRELAVQAGDLGKHDEAIELWQRLVALKPDMPVAYVNMGTAYLKLGKYEDALLSARKAVELAPHMKEALNNYALCQLYLGNASQAIPALEKLMEQEPEYLSAQFVLSAAYCCDGKMKMGLETFEKLRHTITGPGLAVACHDLAKKLVSAQRLEYAISLLEAAIEGKYVNKDVLYLLSECRRTEQETMDCIHASSALSNEFRNQPTCSSR